MSQARQALERLQQAGRSGALDAVCESHDVRVLTVFGSAVRERAGRRSDLDVAVAFRQPATLRHTLDLIDALQDLCGPVEIDLMDLARATPVAKEQALVYCIPLYESERGEFASAQMAAILGRMDTDWLRTIELDLLAR